jgi:hypothetical protein
MLIGAAIAGTALKQDYVRRDAAVRAEAVRGYKALRFALILTLKHIIQMEENIEARFEEHGAILESYGKRLKILKAKLEEAQTQVATRLEDEARDLDSADKALLGRVRALEVAATKIQQELDQLAAVPQDKMDNALRSVVLIGVRDKIRLYEQGSGVLFKRIKTKDGWVYYGFTAYHCYHGVLLYMDKQDTIPEKARMNPKFVIQVFNRTRLLARTDEIEVTLLTDKKARKIKDFKSLKSRDDFCVFTFKSKKDFAISELASDAECKSIETGHPVLGIGIHPVMRPAAYAGSIASVISASDENMAVHTMAWPGMSGSPIFDRKTMKVIGIVQKMQVRPGLGGNVNVAFVQSLHKVDPKHRKLK